MPEDQTTDLEDLLHSQPARDAVQPPVTSRPQVLPFNQLSWENFERLCTRLIAADGEVKDCHRCGKRGDYQAGVDILAHRRIVAEGGLERWGYQCKRWQKMTSGDLRQIVNAFGFPADQYVVLVSFEAGADLRKVVAALPEVDLWDAEDISSQLKGQPELVEDFFGAHWRDAFCVAKRGKRLRPLSPNPFGDTGRITDPTAFSAARSCCARFSKNWARASTSHWWANRRSANRRCSPWSAPWDPNEWAYRRKLSLT
jgi:hypothetical protein